MYITKKHSKKTLRNTRKIGGQIRLNVSYGRNYIKGKQVNKNKTEIRPRVVFPKTDGYYTLIMWDPDTLNPSYLHWLAYNLQTSSDIEQNTLISYTPPTPPSGVHRYFFGLFKQQARLLPQYPKQDGFNIDKFIEYNHLSQVAIQMMTVSS